MTTITTSFDVASVLLGLLILANIGINVYIFLMMRGIATQGLDKALKTLNIPARAKDLIDSVKGTSTESSDLLDAASQALKMPKKDLQKLINTYAPQLAQEQEKNPLASIALKAQKGNLQIADFLPLVTPFLQGLATPNPAGAQQQATRW